MRKRTGSLRWHRRRWWAYLTLQTGKPRQWLDLQTTDEDEAKRRMAREVDRINRGEIVLATKTAREQLVIFNNFADQWIAEREADGVVMAKDERSTLKHHIRPLIGHRPVCEVESADIDAVLRSATKTVAHETVRHIRSLLSRMFKRAKTLRLTKENPVTDVGTPRQRGAVLVKERVILTDNEFAKLVECEAVPLWFRTAAVLSRFVGGQRLGDLNHLQWSSIAEDFSSLLVPRRKTGKAQLLLVPGPARAYLKAWFHACGNTAPEAYLFGLDGGKRPRASRGTSWGKVVRHYLHVSGAVRHECRRGNKPAPKKDKACCENMANDPLFVERATTLPTDFHSFRRGFATGLRRANVDELTSLMVSAHGDTTTHKRYLNSEIAKLELPKEAFPLLTSPPRIVHPIVHTPNRQNEQGPLLLQNPEAFCTPSNDAPIAQLDRATVSEAVGQ